MARPIPVRRGNLGQLGAHTGRSATHLYAQTEILRNIERGIDRLTRTVHHPGAKFAKTEASAAFGGVAAI